MNLWSHVFPIGFNPGGSELWFDPRRGSEKAFLRALDDFAAKSRHPEIQTIPWALWGHSGGGIWADLMSTLHPDKVIGMWLRSGSAAQFRTHPEFVQPAVPMIKELKDSGSSAGNN